VLNYIPITFDALCTYRRFCVFSYWSSRSWVVLKLHFQWELGKTNIRF